MSNDLEILAGPLPETRYETLIRVSQEIGVHRDPKELFAVLANELHRVVPFDYIGVSIRDRDTDTFHDHFIDMESGSVLIPDENVTPYERFVSWVYEHQEPLLTSTEDINPRYERLNAILRKLQIRSTCTLPLTTAHRKLGAISFGSRQLDTYSLEGVRFLSLVAGGIALAFDNAMNLTALGRASEQLQSNNDRLRLLLNLNNRVALHLDLRQVFQAISSELRRVFKCDFVGVALPESSGKQLRQHMVDFPESKGALKEGALFPVEGSFSGLAFRSARPVVLNNLSEASSVWHSDQTFYKMVTDEGFRSGCFLPLISADRALGVLQLTSRDERSFAEQDVEFLDQVANQIAITLKNALEYEQVTQTKERLVEQKHYLEDEIRTEMNFAQIIGNSASLRRVLKQVETVAPTDSTVLIYGETGTGKELIARGIHDLSPRRAKPFVKLNCAAIPTGLLESELFGHEKGAFTGAIAQRIGRFEVANGGTIFLDEIGEVPLELQPKLLRVLQEREFERLGSSRTLRTDARLIAATNRDLEAMVAEQKFRSDLFFRLDVFPVHVPALRERQGDIPLLVRHFTQQCSRRMNKVIETIPAEAMDALCRYHWPGNIRELQNVIERAVIISTGPALSVDVADLKFSKASQPEERAAALNSKTNGALRDVLKETERQHILQALAQCDWIVAGPNGAAERLGMKRSTLRLRMQKLGISRRSA